MRTLQLWLLLGSFLYRTKAEGSTSLSSTASPPPSCCLSKKVGDDWYDLVEHDGDISEHNTCKNGCIYERSESPGSRVCFASGYLEVMCGEGTGDTCPEPPVKYGDRQLPDNRKDVNDRLISLTSSTNNATNGNLLKIWENMKNRKFIIDVMCCADGLLGLIPIFTTCGNNESCLMACNKNKGLHCGNFVASNYTWDLNCGSANPQPCFSCFNSFCFSQDSSGNYSALATVTEGTGLNSTTPETEQIVSVTASSPGVFLPAFNLWYCPRKVTSWYKVDDYPECCFHKTINDRFPKRCCNTWGVCP